jgi:hypothetical protein
MRQSSFLLPLQGSPQISRQEVSEVEPVCCLLVACWLGCWSGNSGKTYKKSSGGGQVETFPGAVPLCGLVRNVTWRLWWYWQWKIPEADDGRMSPGPGQQQRHHGVAEHFQPNGHLECLIPIFRVK